MLPCRALLAYHPSAMRTLLLLALILFSSCASGPEFKKMSHAELTEYMMQESLLTTALSSASASAANCMQPFENNMPKGAYGRLTSILRDHFKYEDMYSSIRGRIIAGSNKKQAYDLSEGLSSEVWKKYLQGTEGAASVGQEKYMQLYRSLDDGSFDLTSNRANLVAKITDQDYMTGLVNLSNKQVMRLLSASMPSSMTDQQQNVLTWISNELKTLNDTHVKTLFATTYLSTEPFSETDLAELLRIRSHEVIKLSKLALEEELNKRYHEFFANMNQLSKPGKK